MEVARPVTRSGSWTCGLANVPALRPRVACGGAASGPRPAVPSWGSGFGRGWGWGCARALPRGRGGEQGRSPRAQTVPDTHCPGTKEFSSLKSPAGSQGGKPTAHACLNKEPWASSVLYFRPVVSALYFRLKASWPPV